MNYTHARQREITFVVSNNANELEKYQPFRRDYNLPFIGSSIMYIF